jgi:hypothetical protein
MNNNFVRAMVGCTVTFCFVLATHSISFAFPLDRSSGLARDIVDSGTRPFSAVSAVSLDQISFLSPRSMEAESALVWLFGAALVIAFALLIIGALAVSTVSALPSLPHEAAAVDFKPVPVTKPGDGGRVFSPQLSPKARYVGSLQGRSLKVRRQRGH